VASLKNLKQPFLHAPSGQRVDFQTVEFKEQTWPDLEAEYSWFDFQPEYDWSNIQEGEDWYDLQS